MADPSAAGDRRQHLAFFRWRYAGALGIIALALIAWFVRKTPRDALPTDPFPLTPLSFSPFRNTGPEARYVGSQACVTCHPGEHASHGRTGMGRAMAEVLPDREPPDAVFDHALSGRRFQVYRKDGKLRHREALLARNGEEIEMADYPLKY